MSRPFEVSFDDTNKLIEVIFNDGQDNYMMRLQCIEHMEGAIEQSGYDRLLVNLSRIAEPMSIINQFTLGEKVSQSTIQNVRTAVLHSPKSENPNDIITLVSGNRGRDIKDFASREKAVEWLHAP
jgi:Cu/Ag efflux pump CusA